MKSKKDKTKTKENLAAGLATSEVVDRYGSANEQHIIGHRGFDNETGQQLQKGLKDISEHKVNKQFEQNNLRQQAGYSAEIKKTSRTNAENIINKSDERITRTDDITIKGKKLVNDETFDHARVDKHGNAILTTDGKLTGGSQQKVHFGNVKKYDKYSKPDLYEKYQDAVIDVPSDQYHDIQKRYTERIEELKIQEKRLRSEGKNEIADQKRAEIGRKQDLKSRFRDSGVSTQEAMEARVNPLLSTVKDMGKVSHRAGVEAAKGAMAISGSISIIQNVIALSRGEKDLQEALKDTAFTTARSVGISYSSAFVGSLVKAGMQQAKSGYVRTLSKTSLPALVVTTCLETGKCIKRYIDGETDEIELMQELGETGSGMLAGSLGATIGQIAIPIPVVGSVIGGMIGYTLNSIFYAEAINAFKKAEEAEENYYRVKAICEISRKQITDYKNEISEQFNKEFNDSMSFYNDSFEKLNTSIMEGDLTKFENIIGVFSHKFGTELHYKTFSEFDKAMESNETIKI